MENYCKLFLFPILIFQILFGCAEPSGGSGGSASNNDSTSNNDSSEDSSKKLQAISQDIKIYLDEKAQIRLTVKTIYSQSKKYIITQNPKNGSLSGTAPNFRYKPHSGFVGKDQFLFRVTQRTWSSKERKYVTRESDSAVIKINVVPHDTAPVAQAIASGSHSITISWQKIHGATSYTIFRENSSVGTFQTVLKAGVTGSSFTDSGLSPTTEYHYQVRAMWHSLESKKSKTVSALTSQPLYKTISYNFDKGLPEHWIADSWWKSKSPKTGNSSIGFEGLNSGSTSMKTQSFQVPSYGAILSFWHRFKKPINYKIEWSYDGIHSWTSLHQKSYKSNKVVTDTLHRPVSSSYYGNTYYSSYTKIKNYDIPPGASDYTIKVSGNKSCTYGYRKIYVNNYSYEFGTTRIPTRHLWGINGQFKIKIYDYCSSSGGSYDLEIQYSGSEMKDDGPISNWEKISIPLDAAKGKTAWFRFSATNNYKDSIWNIDDLTITPNPVPTPKPKISTIDKHTLKVSWDSVSDGMLYDLYRSESEYGNYELIESSIKQTYFTDKNLKTNTKYFYKVRAGNSNTKSPLSSTVNAFTIPSPPSGSIANPLSFDSVLIFWNLVKGVGNYELYRSNSPNSGFQIISSNQKSLGFYDTTVKCETNYYYRIKSVHNGQKSEFSDFSEVLTPSTIPSKATSILGKLVNNGSEIKLSWGAADCAKNYNIYRSTNGSEYVLISNSKNLDFTDQNLEKGTSYTYMVSGVSAIGEGPKSTHSNSLLTAPKAPIIAPLPSWEADRIYLRWNKVDTATNYFIYRLNPQNGSYIAVGSTKQHATPTFAVLGLDSFTKYTFKVSAVNSGGEGLQSSSYNAITLPPPPKGIMVETISHSESIIQWDLLKGATSYNIYRLERLENNSNGTSQKLIKQNWKSTIFVDMTLEKGKVYFYRITANFLNTTKFNFKNGMWDGNGPSLVEGTYRKWIKSTNSFSGF